MGMITFNIVNANNVNAGQSLELVVSGNIRWGSPSKRGWDSNSMHMLMRNVVDTLSGSCRVYLGGGGKEAMNT